MDFLAWMTLVGAVLLLTALTSAYVRRLPITTSAIYLLIGLAIGPAALNLIRVDFVEWRTWFEHFTEIAVILSLFVGGLKLRLPLSNAAWSAAFRLAGPVMIASIAGVAAFAHFVLGFSWPEGLLLGAIVAPTDPVLASTVSVNDSGDDDRLRYGLSGEAGFNDGAAFPFVIFALMWMEYDSVGEWAGKWALHRLLWSIPAGLLVGYFLGKGVGMLAIRLRTAHKESDAPNDFVALALIALAYAGAEYVHAWGFLAAFAAGIGFRHAEMRTVADNPLPEHVTETPDPASGGSIDHPPAEKVVGRKLEDGELDHPTKAAGVVLSDIISFGDTSERLLEVMMIILVGICLAAYWDWRAVPLALALFFVIRPLAAMVFLVGTPTATMQRLLMGWFGIRGIGSLYYLSYSLNHGLSENIGMIVSLTLSVVAISILLHGISSQPILDFYERSIGSGEKP